MSYSTYIRGLFSLTIRGFYRCLLLVVLPLSSLTAGQVMPDDKDSLQREKKLYSVFLIGDAGVHPLQPTDPVLTLLEAQLAGTGEKGSVIFLGNNLLSKGHVLKDALVNTETDRLLLPQLEALKHFRGKPIFIPGNYEWGRGKKNGWEQLQKEEKLIEEYLNKGNVFLPDGGCPGPVEINLNEWLTLVILDTQWWLHPYDKPEAESDCETQDASGLVIQLEDILHRNAHKRILVVGHHPMYSYGEHGGYSPAKLHLFPLTALHPSLYVPLPVVGSLYPLYRKVFGNLQDIPHPRYLFQRNALVNVFNKHPDIIYASAHEQSLQHIVKKGVHYINSGSFSATRYLSSNKRDELLFGVSKKGFARLDYLQQGEVWLSFFAVSADGEKGELMYQKKITDALLPQLASASQGKMLLADTLITVAASNRYRAGAVKRKLLGETYRSLWQKPIEFPVFDINKEIGGLTILKRGGGMQTKSLRLQDKDGKEYVLRSVDKTTGRAIPRSLQQTLAADIVQDQISASHPYGALVIPPLAQKAGVYSTNPKVVYVADDARLGKYQTLFANTLSILEERPEEEQSDTPEQEKKVYSTTKLLSRLHADNNNRVNEHEVLRARLFDMLIGDWDRHDDQWRWLAKKTGSDITYYPLPRDRDQAFFINEGVLPKIASRKWIMPKFQGFDYKIRDVAGFNFNARYFDRSFLNELALPDWLAMADTLQTLLTDSIIEQAIGEWPKKVRELSGKEIVAKLKSRREHLKEYARIYYHFLSREVDIVGSEKREYFHVQRLNESQTKVKVYNLQGGVPEKEPFYQRIFDHTKTKEIRLYGLGGEDRFKIEGNVKQSVKVRIIGGKGKDTITDSSIVKGLSRKTWVYDTKQGNVLSLNAESKNLTFYDRMVNEYNRRAFQYNYLSPLASVQFNPDDGIFVGGGVLYRTHGFRKEPFATRHRLTGNFAFATHAYNFDYRGEFTDVLHKLDIETNAEVKGPNYVNNFFGYGNESINEEGEQGISFYRARVRSIRLNTLLIKNIFRTQKLFIGPAYETYQVENTRGRFISQTNENGLEADNVFRQKQYAGLKMGFLFDTRDNEMLPTSGTYWHMESGLFKGINGQSGDYAKIESALSFYWSFRLPARVTLATRFGGGINFGDYEFFQANTLGGLTNLRGYRRTRFTGKSSLYNNTELRVRVFGFRTYFFPAYVGILGFHDVGRVWVDGEESNTWHTSAGGGIWLAPFNRAVISLMYGISKEDKLPLLRVGFLF
jgi:hypothetical protein